MAEEAVEAVMDMEGYLRMAKYPIIRHTDMVEEVRAEAVELCITGARAHAPRRPCFAAFLAP